MRRKSSSWTKWGLEVLCELCLHTCTRTSRWTELLGTEQVKTAVEKRECRSKMHGERKPAWEHVLDIYNSSRSRDGGMNQGEEGSSCLSNGSCQWLCTRVSPLPTPQSWDLALPPSMVEPRNGKKKKTMKWACHQWGSIMQCQHLTWKVFISLSWLGYLRQK